MLTGITAVLEAMHQRNTLLALSYHRIGDASATEYDGGTFSGTADELDYQIGYVRKHFHILSLEEVLAIASGESPFHPGVLVTFDDGCLDNFTLAFPILRSHGIPAVFFLPTAFIGTKHLPWWDRIAYVVKHSKNRVIRLHYPESAEFDLESADIREVVRQVLRLFKHPSTTDQDRFLSELDAVCEVTVPADSARQFMNWDEVRQMRQAGMAFGSHTHSHEILSKLTGDQQLEELRCSRDIIQRELGCRVSALAYPVGERHTFTKETVRALVDNGYQGAFSKYGGVNVPGRIQQFDILRFDIENMSHPRFRLRMLTGAVAGKYWF